jgi:hypothetical protein
MFQRLLITIGRLFLIPLFDAGPALAQDRSQVVERLAKGISAADVHKIYIPDFPDPSNHPSGAGAFYAAIFRVRGFSSELSVLAASALSFSSYPKNFANGSQ